MTFAMRKGNKHAIITKTKNQSYPRVSARTPEIWLGSIIERAIKPVHKE